MCCYWLTDALWKWTAVNHIWKSNIIYYSLEMLHNMHWSDKPSGKELDKRNNLCKLMCIDCYLSTLYANYRTGQKNNTIYRENSISTLFTNFFAHTSCSSNELSDVTHWRRLRHPCQSVQKENKIHLICSFMQGHYKWIRKTKRTSMLPYTGSSGYMSGQCTSS